MKGKRLFEKCTSGEDSYLALFDLRSTTSVNLPLPTESLKTKWLLPKYFVLNNRYTSKMYYYIINQVGL